MRNHLESVVMDWGEDECKERYFQALTDKNVRAFEDLYIERKEWRPILGKAIAICLGVLIQSGTDGHQRLSAIWCPNKRDTYLATLDSRKWSGLLTDTTKSCAVAVMAPDCLQFRSNLLWASNCNAISKDHENSPKSQFSVLETAVVVNSNARIPKKLIRDGNRWTVERLRLNDGFDLGESGSLKVLGVFHQSRGLMTRWAASTFGKEMTEAFRERILKKNTTPYSWEQVLCEEECSIEPINVHVASHW